MTGELALAAVAVVIAWWASTAAVMKLVWTGRALHRPLMVVATLVALAALVGVHWASRLETVVGAYVAFGAALAIWGWHELAFLLGVLTGPRKTACPPGARGWNRFRYATEAVIHHEIALALTLLVIVALSWEAANPIAAWTFGALWAMRLSAKLNLFFGVHNISDELVPERLRYLSSYFRRGRPTPLLALSILVGVAVAGTWAFTVVQAAPGFLAVGRTLVLVLLLLAVLEHVFLAVPLGDAALWRWALGSDASKRAER